MGTLFSSMNFLCLVHYGCMWMVHEIFHAMFYSNKGSFYWCIHISDDMHCEILKMVASLDSGVHDSTNPVI